MCEAKRVLRELKIEWTTGDTPSYPELFREMKSMPGYDGCNRVWFNDGSCFSGGQLLDTYVAAKLLKGEIDL